MIKVVLFDVGGVLVRPTGIQFKLYSFSRKLSRANLRIAILSNIDLSIGFILKRTPIYKGFSPVILSYEEKTRKPFPEIYNITIKRLGVKPNEILFIDNLTENIIGAQKSGMHTIHAVGTRQIIADIKLVLKKENNLDI